MSDSWPPTSTMRTAWKHLGLSAGLGLTLGVAAACSEPESVTPTYAGSCPVLIECAAALDITEYPAQDLLVIYGDPDDPDAPDQGTCWASGIANHGQCRQSCVDTLTLLNAEAAKTGRDCGECVDDSDCTDFGASATCRSGYCGRAEIGDIDLGGASTGNSAGDETGMSGGDEGEDPQDLPLDMACEGDAPRVAFTTSLGTMVFEIDALAEPSAAKVFLQHVSADFYDDTLIHRVVMGAFAEAGGFAPGFAPLEPLVTASSSGTPALGHGDDTLALTRLDDSVGAALYFIDPPGPDAPTGVPIGTLVEGAEVRDAIAAVAVFDFPWQGFVLQDVPTVDVVIIEAKCE